MHGEITRGFAPRRLVLAATAATMRWRRSAFAAFGLFAGFAVLAGSPAQATQGNNVDVACNGIAVAEKLCRGTGGVCGDPAFAKINPPSASNSPQDNIDFTVPAGGATITFTLTSPKVTIKDATQQNGDGDIDPGNNAFSLTPGGSSKTLTFTAPAGKFSQQIQLDNVSGFGTRFRFVTYEVKCTPPPAPTLTIVKAVINGDGKASFSFISQPSIGTIPPLTPGAGNTSVASSPFKLVADTAYTLTEDVAKLPADWKFTTASCAVNGGGAVGTAVANGIKFTPKAGQDITCTLTNTRELPAPTLTIVKAVINGDGKASFSFISQPSIGTIPPLTPGVGNTSVSSSPFKLVAGTAYTLTEDVAKLPADWKFTSASCAVNGGGAIGTPVANGVSFTPSGGQNITCTLTNTREPPPPPPASTTLTIVKAVINGDGKTAFSFSSEPLIGTIPAMTPGPGNTSISAGPFTLNAGTAYAIKRTTLQLPAGWKFTSAACAIEGGNPIGAPATDGISFTPSAGQGITCTFISTREVAPPPPSAPTTLTIVKAVINGDGNTPFSFVSQPSIGNIPVLTPGPGNTSISSSPFTLVAGTAYTITENTQQLPAGWKFTGAACAVNGGGAIGAPVASGISFTPSAGQNVTCTLTYTRQTGTIKVKKITIGGDAIFGFALASSVPQHFQLSNGGVKSFASLAVGHHSVELTQLPAGWIVKEASCGKGTRQGNKVTVDLSGNEEITCTFISFKEKDDRMGEVAKAFVHRRVDNLLTHSPDRARLLRRLDETGAPKGGPFAFSGANNLEPSGFDRFGAGPPGFRQPGFGLGQVKPGLPGLWLHDDSEHPGSGTFSMLGASTNFAGDYKFSTSLSEIRAAAMAADDRRVEQRLKDAGLGFAGMPYPRPAAGMRQGLDLWIEGHAGHYVDGTGGISRDGKFNILYLGADYPVAPHVLVGALVQFDWARETLRDPALSGEIGGSGWLGGPYIGIKLYNNLYFDARVAWGTSENEITLRDPATATRTGSFDTTRWLATAALTGNYLSGPWRLTPQVGLAFGNEWYDPFKNSLGQTVTGADVSIARLTYGTEVGYRFVFPNGVMMEPHIGIFGIWNFDSDNLLIDSALVIPGQSRARVEGGVIVRGPGPGGASVRAAISHDGIGDDDFSATTGKLWFNLPLN